MRRTPPVLYHYTCDHGHAGIVRDGLIRPGPDGFVWLTDMAIPIRAALGLTSVTLSCDRMTYCHAVLPASGIGWWPDVRRTWVQTSAEWRQHIAGLEGAAGARPAHWWVSVNPVEVIG